MNEPPDPKVAAQLEAVKLDSGRPLLICDADEVLFAFMEGFERFLHAHDHYYVWRSYKLSGNVYQRGNAEAMEDAALAGLLAGYWAKHAEDMPPVPDAMPTLAALAALLQVVVLTNVPFEHKAARERSLRRHGLEAPTIANIGLKGPAVGWLAARVAAPSFFIDDSPGHHASVAAHAPGVRRIHFVGDRRLAGLLPQAPDSHHRPDSWAAMRATIEQELRAAGH
ncbi:MAG: hypothetical protein AB7P52_10680 [Alphaproteobacteria bacterium]